MDASERRSLERWTGADLISAEQARAIEAFEAERFDRGDGAHWEFNPGALLGYAGVAVALIAALALAWVMFDDGQEGERAAFLGVLAVVAAVVGWPLSRARGGAPSADALGAAMAVLVGAAVLNAFDAAGWLSDRPGRSEDEHQRALHELRATNLGISLAAAAAGWLAYRLIRSPMALLPAGVAIVWAVTVIAWWLSNSDENAPGQLGGVAVVVVGYGLALTLLVPRVRHALIAPSVERARFWLELAFLGAGQVASMILAGEHGGGYEVLLLALAVGQLTVALLTARRIWLVGAAVSLYGYVGFLVFRTFEGAAAAVALLSAIGLGTALAGVWWQRGGFRLRRRGDGAP